MFNVVLVEPEIPPNTGNIARLCAGTGFRLILVGELGFDISDASVKRAGLDYWHLVDVVHFKSDIWVFLADKEPTRCHFLTTHAQRAYTTVSFQKGDYLIFGSETRGLGKDVLSRYSDRCCTIPLVNKDRGMRSLNLSNAVAIISYEALRQTSDR